MYVCRFCMKIAGICKKLAFILFKLLGTSHRHHKSGVTYLTIVATPIAHAHCSTCALLMCTIGLIKNINKHTSCSYVQCSAKWMQLTVCVQGMYRTSSKNSA